MTDEQPAAAPSLLRTRDTTGLPTHPATGRHRVINSCRGGHEEVIEVHTEAERLAAMVSGCRTVMPDGRSCEALVNVSRLVGPDGVQIGMVLIPDERTA